MGQLSSSRRISFGVVRSKRVWGIRESVAVFVLDLPLADSESDSNAGAGNVSRLKIRNRSRGSAVMLRE